MIKLKEKLDKMMRYLACVSSDNTGRFWLTQKQRENIGVMQELKKAFGVPNNEDWVDKYFYQLNRNWKLFGKKLANGNKVYFYQTYYIKYQIKRQGLFTPVCTPVETLTKNEVAQQKMEGTDTMPVYGLGDRLDILMDIQSGENW